MGVYVVSDESLKQIDFKVLHGLGRVAVSNGGGRIAIVRDRGVPPVVELYKSNEGLKTPDLILKCHSTNIIHCSFAPGDPYVITASSDGAIYAHSTSDGRRLFESTLRGVALTRVIVSYSHEIPRDFI